VEDNLRALHAPGVDAVFADFPATAVAVRQARARGQAVPAPTLVRVD